MQAVRVKGVANPMQFPDDMDIEDIKAFLQKRFANMAVSGESTVDVSPRQATAQAYEPTMSEKLGQGIADKLYDTGIISDRYGAQRIGENLGMVGEVLPVVGDATAGDEFGKALAGGDGVGMALGALGAIPLVGDAAKKIKKLTDNVALEKEAYEFAITPLKAEYRAATQAADQATKDRIMKELKVIRRPLAAAESSLFIAKQRATPKPEKIADVIKPNKTFEGTVYHQTNKDFDEFDFDKGVDGTAWFTDSKANFSDPTSSSAAASGTGKILERSVKLEKAAGFDELNKYGVGELIDQGYDGAVLGNDIQVFNPKAIRPASLSANEAFGGESTVLKDLGMDENTMWYHGSDKDFDEFDFEKVGDNYDSHYGKGAYFASKFGHASEHGKVKNFKLAVKNPMVWSLSRVSEAREKGMELSDYAKSLGYDGIIVGDRHNAQMVAFENNQIKRDTTYD